MEDEVGYYLGLSYAPGVGPGYFASLCAYFGSAQSIFEASQQDLIDCMGSKDRAVKLYRHLKLFDYKKTLFTLIKKEITVLIKSDKRYPRALKDLSDSPICLFVKGDLDEHDLNYERMIAVVGTRNVSSYGTQATRMITHELSSAGFTIVSGMAIGVDALAHEVALSYKNPTVAVLGCAVDVVYPMQNARIYERIVDGGGLVVSECLPGQKPLPGLFVARNRIVSGMSCGVVVVEGAMDSGAMITARVGAQQGKDVFAVPGHITSALARGPLSLIRDGAILVSEPRDILEHYAISAGNIKAFEDITQRDIWQKLNTKEQAVLTLLLKESLHFEHMIEQTSWEAGELMRVLSILEIHGLVEKNQTGGYDIVGTP